MSYRAAVLQGIPEKFYPEIWKQGGEVFDPELGVHLLGGYDQVHTALACRDGYTSDASIIPWWLNSRDAAGGPNPNIPVSPEVFEALGPFFGYPGAIVSLDGPKHLELRQQVLRAMRRAETGIQDSAAIDGFVEARLGELQGQAQSIGGTALRSAVNVVDLQKEFIQPVALDLLAHRLGLPDDMKDAVHASTVAQAEFTWPHTAPAYEDQPELARGLIDMLERCQRLVDSYSDVPEIDLPSNVTGHLVLSERHGHMERGEVIANLFGLVHAGYITTAGTVTRLVDMWLHTGRWARLDTDAPNFAKKVEQGMNEYTSVHGWMRRKGPDGPHAIALIEAANLDPQRGDRPLLSFSPRNPHRCLGESDANNTATAIIGSLRKTFPDMQPHGVPHYTANVAFKEQSHLNVQLTP